MNLHPWAAAVFVAGVVVMVYLTLPVLGNAIVAAMQ